MGVVDPSEVLKEMMEIACMEDNLKSLRVDHANISALLFMLNSINYAFSNLILFELLQKPTEDREATRRVQGKCLPSCSKTQKPF